MTDSHHRYCSMARNSLVLGLPSLRRASSISDSAGPYDDILHPIPNILDNLKHLLDAMLQFPDNAIKGSIILPWMVSDYDWIKAGRRRERILTYELYKPRTHGEIRQGLGLRPNSKLTSTLAAMTRRGISYHPARRLIALPPKGRRLRKRLTAEKGLEYRYTQPRLDWKAYVWVLGGRQRKALLHVLKDEAAIAADIIHRIRNPTAQELQTLRTLSREDAYKMLHRFVERGLANIEKRGRTVLFSIKKDGISIRKQMHVAWLIFFGVI